MLALPNGQGQGNRSTPNIRDPRVNERCDNIATLIHFIHSPTKALPVPIAPNWQELFARFRKLLWNKQLCLFLKLLTKDGQLNNRWPGCLRFIHCYTAAELKCNILLQLTKPLLLLLNLG